MGAKNLIHVKINFNAAINSKRDMLETEAAILRMNKNLKKYHLLRTETLKIKIKLHRKLKELITTLNKLQTSLPKIKNSDINVYEKKEEVDKKIKEVKVKHYDAELESQLEEIQEKLRALSTNTAA